MHELSTLTTGGPLSADPITARSTNQSHPACLVLSTMYVPCLPRRSICGFGERCLFSVQTYDSRFPFRVLLTFGIPGLSQVRKMGHGPLYPPGICLLVYAKFIVVVVLLLLLCTASVMCECFRNIGEMCVGIVQATTPPNAYGFTQSTKQSTGITYM